ncbi:MAG: hypothetical protein NTV51_06150 [Verrucomicrobia bacterium]|nr:hypothetical protein [Verrucomicrobiota bacterium]
MLSLPSKGIFWEKPGEDSLEPFPPRFSPTTGARFRSRGLQARHGIVWSEVASPSLPRKNKFQEKIEQGYLNVLYP